MTDATKAHTRRVMGSHSSPHWSTPQGLYEDLNREFAFTLDPCPLRGNEDGLTKGAVDDGLARSWGGERVYCNPPYGHGVGNWLKKSQWWHNYALKADEIRFVRGRLKFGGAKSNAPFPSVVLVFRKK